MLYHFVWGSWTPVSFDMGVCPGSNPPLIPRDDSIYKWSVFGRLKKSLDILEGWWGLYTSWFPLLPSVHLSHASASVFIRSLGPQNSLKIETKHRWLFPLFRWGKESPSRGKAICPDHGKVCVWATLRNRGLWLLWVHFLHPHVASAHNEMLMGNNSQGSF